jgi:23S rRNA (adenine2503-C2)-methyltransferase
MGLKRHLQTAEILGQVLAVQDDCWTRHGREEGTPPDLFQNIVFMGMGEPLHNFDNVARAVGLLTDEAGFNFSPRKITVSTSGLVPAIKRFGEESVRANLAISLNATTDEVRTKIIPINKKWPLDDLLTSLRAFPLTGRKKLTIEYVMLRGVNDSDEDMKRLPGLLSNIPSKINLIPYNENAGLGFFGPKVETVQKWQDYLLKKGMYATIRWSKGQDISAACGQLATEA